LLQPKIPRDNELWFRLESRLLAVLRLALEMMRKKETSFPTPEDSISRTLEKYIRKANEELRREDRHIDNLPVFQAQNQPDHNLADGNESEKKKPDFLWQWYDATEKVDYNRYRQYAIECKRLGKPPSQFCRAYVAEGVCRFINPEHSYSKYSPSGTMLGYIQSMEVKAVLSEVNKEAFNRNIPAIELSRAGWKKKGVSRLEHEFNRPKVVPTHFTLRHFWVDLQ
jgi:hypothetical protein